MKNEHQSTGLSFFKNDDYSLALDEKNNIYISSKTILNGTEFEINFKNYKIYIDNPFFLDAIKNHVTLEDITMSWWADMEFSEEVYLEPFTLISDGLKIIKDKRSVYELKNYSTQLRSLVIENNIQAVEEGGYFAVGLRKIDKVIVSQIYAEFVLHPLLKIVMKTSGFLNTVNTETLVLSSKDENQWLEFKETSFWDQREEHKMKKVAEGKNEKYIAGKSESVRNGILKLICAFGNSDGGVLIIGLQDAKNGGEITGWQTDQQIKSLKNKDEFELTWRKWVSDFIDKFSSLELVFSFDNIKDKEVVRITVPPRKVQYSYASLSLKSGTEKIYTRSGNQVLEILPGEIGKVFKGRFL